jgi:CheY-like chemotaxis protein
MRSDKEPEFEGASILVVEDDDDIRDLLVTLLEMAGYAVTACPTAEQGLNALREGTFDFVLTDYALPNRTGGWLLHQAASEGLLDATPALVVTAHPNTPDLNGFEVFHKPFDLDDLVAHVRHRLDGGDSKPSSGNRLVRPSRSKNQGNGGNHDTCPEPIELILYVSADSPRSANAVNNIKRVLSRYRSDKVRLTICDLARNPTLGDADGIAFTPTLVKRSPGPRTYILGHITNPDVLIELLDGCDLDSQV